MVAPADCLAVKSGPISGADSTFFRHRPFPAQGLRPPPMPLDFDAARQIMVDSQVRTNDVPDMAIQKAMRRAPREQAMPADKRYLAYADTEVEYAPGRWLLRPRDIGKLLYAARPKAGERALAIAAPYAAMVMEQMGLSVTRHDGPDLKAPPAGAFDVVVSEGAVAAVPEAWLAALASGGRAVFVVRDGPVGKVRLYVKSDGDLGWREVFDATPPVMAGFEPEVRFAF
jgi:protein-L-isoaspartate(D-aspartate) O-methyltransferase